MRAALLLLLLAGTVQAGIPAGHEVYPFLHRAWLHGATGQPPPTVRPETIPALLERLAAIDRNRHRLPAAERAELDELLSDLAIYSPTADSLLPDSTRWSSRTGAGNTFFAYGSHLYAKRQGDFAFSFDPIVSWQAIYDGAYNDEPLLRSVAGFEVRAALGEHWTAGVHFTDTGEYNQNENDEPYTSGVGYEAVTALSGGSSFDETMAFLEYSGEFVDLGVGRDRMQRGPALDSGLLLSGAAPSYLYLQARVRLKPWLVFDYFHGRLDPEPVPEDTVYQAPSGMYRKVVNDKWLAAHRLEWTPTWWASFGLTETVIYAERGPELGYLVPINFFWSENHHQDRDDNIAWGFDLRLQPLGGVTVYGEWLLDETSLSGIFSNKLHNRTGYVAGVAVADPVGWRSSLLEIQFTRIRPYVYSHWFAVSVYTHNGTVLGSTTPPNGQALSMRLSKRFGGQWEISLLGERSRHGVTPDGDDPVGGSVFELVPLGKRNETYPLLGGETLTAHRAEVSLRWEPLEKLALRARMGVSTAGGETFSLFLGSFAYNL